MEKNVKVPLLALIALVSISLEVPAQTQTTPAQNEMTFFVTSVGSGNGADLGGIAGADQHCQSLAKAAGADTPVWRAYLSISPAAGTQAVNARDRIGRGPWHNAKGVLIARDIDELHARNNINKQTALTEKGSMVNSRGDTPLMHDILTGSQPDGRAFQGDKDMTCGNWTKSGAGSAMVGHHDRQGLRDDDASKSWNSSHPSSGCSQDGLRSTGGNGLFYCFAAD